MKIALYIEDGREQIVLTPANTTEKAILGKLYDEKRTVNVVRGQFYQTSSAYLRHGGGDDSTILVLERPAPEPAPEEPKHRPDQVILAT